MDQKGFKEYQKDPERTLTVSGFWSSQPPGDHNPQNALDPLFMRACNKDRRAQLRRFAAGAPRELADLKGYHGFLWWHAHLLQHLYVFGRTRPGAGGHRVAGPAGQARERRSARGNARDNAAQIEDHARKSFTGSRA